MAEEDQGAEPGMEDRMKITRPQKITVFFTAIFVTGMALITGVSDMAAADENNGETSIPLSAAVSEYQDESADSAVYMTTDISPEGLMKVYRGLSWMPSGKVAVKLSTGEPPASNYLSPDLIKELVQSVDGTIVECNTAYGGSRASNEMHYQVAEDHGFTKIADFQILDENGSMELPVHGGSRLTENYVGAHFSEYGSYLVLSHFKGHTMAGFGGAIKNISIGLGSSEGKCWIHSGGTSRTNAWGGEQDAFLESMAEAGKSVSDYLGNGERIVYVNVMNRLSVDCDCDGHPAEPEMHDIGILVSTDPVALDQACIDLVYAQKDTEGRSLVSRIESRNGLHTLEHAQSIGLGNREYHLVDMDSQGGGNAPGNEPCIHDYAGQVTVQSTCVVAGIRTYTCAKCGDSYTEGIPAQGHRYQTDIAPATMKKDGSITTQCTVCREIKSESVIYAVKSVTLSSASYVYNGKVRKPSVIVKDGKGKTLKNGTDYTIRYPGGRKKVGKHQVIVSFRGQYAGSAKKSFSIIPKAVSISKITPKVKGFQVRWKKQKVQADGYEVSYSLNSRFTKPKTGKKRVKGRGNNILKVTKLKEGKKYYVRVRTYKEIENVKYYSKWSRIKTVKVKKA